MPPHRSHPARRIRRLLQLIRYGSCKSGEYVRQPLFAYSCAADRGHRFRARTAASGVALGEGFSPRKPGPSKNAIYECGLESTGDAWIQFKPGYYLYAIIFLIFDVEAIFLLPFAVAFTGLSHWPHASPCWFLCFCWWKAWSGPGRRSLVWSLKSGL